MNDPNSLPGPESHQETSGPPAKGIASGRSCEALRDALAAVEAVPELPPVWRDEDGHDEWCEGGWDPWARLRRDQPVGRSAPCGCGGRAGSGDYPDGRRDPE